MEQDLSIADVMPAGSLERPGYSAGLAQRQSPYERVYRTDWNNSDAVSLAYTPQRGREMVGISLGWADTSGGCLIEHPELPGGQLPIDPVSPFVGFIRGPFRVFPSFSVPAAQAGTNICTLDLLVWYERPPSNVLQWRGPLIVSGTLTGAGSIVPVPIAGRKRITVQAITGGVGPVVNIDVGILSYVPGAGAITTPVYTNASLATATSFAIELDSNNRPPAKAGSDSANSWIPTQGQYLTLSAGAGGSVSYRIECRDY